MNVVIISKDRFEEVFLDVATALSLCRFEALEKSPDELKDYIQSIHRRAHYELFTAKSKLEASAL